MSPQCHTTKLSKPQVSTSDIADTCGANVTRAVRRTRRSARAAGATDEQQ